MVGRLGPFAIALVMTPLLIHALGDVRWGIFTLALAMLNMSGLFDLGLGRALTREIAERIADADAEGAARVTITALSAMAVAGCIGGGLAGAGVAIWMNHPGVVPAPIQPEARASLLLLCGAIPFMLLNAGLWGVLTAFQQFRAANLVNVVVSCIYYILPWLALVITDSLIAAMAALLVTRTVYTVCYAWLCLRLLPGLLVARPKRATLRLLLRRGGWMTLSNLSFPLLSYADRFVVGAIVSPVASGFYGAPADVALRLGVFSSAVTSSAYPVIAATYRSASATTARVLRDSAKTIMALVLPISCLLVVFGKALLVIWIGQAFAEGAGGVLPVLAFGVFFAALDGLVATLIDGIGRPEENAKMSGLQLLIFIPVLLILITKLGIVGAALAWSGRTAIDVGLRSWFAARAAPALRPALIGMLANAAPCVGLLVAAVVVAAFDPGMPAGALIVGAAIPTIVFGVFDSADRARLLRTVRAFVLKRS